MTESYYPQPLVTSDPIIGQSDFYGQRDIWMRDSPAIPTGRLRAAAPYLTVDVTWTAVDSNGVPLLPPDEQLVFFKDVLLVRDPIREFVPRPGDTVGPLDFYARFPLCVYAYPHWMTRLLAPDDPDNIIGGMKWFLFYGEEAGIVATRFVGGESPDQTALNSTPYDVDSEGQTGDPTPPYSGLDMTGWTLVLLKRFFRQLDVSTPLEVEFHIYGGWKLKPKRNKYNDPLPTLVDLTTPQEWIPYHNPLLFPQHKLILRPFQA